MKEKSAKSSPICNRWRVLSSRRASKQELAEIRRMLDEYEEGKS